jgi:branched-chain amino acid transport system permease protein
MDFLLIQTLNGLASASLLFIVSLGLTLIFGVTRIVNFAHGSLYMLGAYLTAALFDKLGGGALGFWGGAVLAAGIVAIVGALIEVAVLRRIYAAPELLQLIATFGAVLVIKDAALYLWGPEAIVGPRVPGFRGAVEIFGKPLPQYDLLLIAIGPLLLVATWVLLKRTDWGTRVRAATQDREMAAALGVNQSILFTSVFMLGSFLAGLSGALALPREPANLDMDLSIIADVFVVTVVGGLGSIPGAYVAAVIVSVAKAWCIGIGDVDLAGMHLSFSKLTLVAEFVIMAVVLVFKPWGLFGAAPAIARHSPSAIVPLHVPGREAIWALAATALALLALPLAVDQYTLVLATDVLVFALFAASLGLLMGQGGMASFGHAAFFGAGAYAAAVAAKAGLPFAAALAAGIGFAALAGIGYGWFCVRLDGVHRAMLTLAFAQITWAIAFQWDAVTGGSNGMFGMRPPDWLGSKTSFYLFTVVVAGGVIVLLWRTAHSAFGYALRAARDSPLRADAIGIDMRRVQLRAFIAAAASAGLAGTIFMFSKGSLSPDTLSIPRSMDALIMLLLGGVQTLVGPAVGAAVFTFLQDWLTRATEYRQAVLGLSVIGLCVAFPQGIVGSLRRWLDRAG